MRATEMREKRAKTSLQKARDTIRTRSKWPAMKGRMYSAQYRSLALAFTRAGCAQARVGALLGRMAKVFNIKIKRLMCRRTVGCAVTEAGIKVRLQLAHELARTKYEGWEIASRKIADTYANSPLARRDALQGHNYDADDIWRKMVAHNADHANDVRASAAKCIEKKHSVAEVDFGQKSLEGMTDAEVEDALWEVVEEMCDDPAVLDPKSLPEDVSAEALPSLAAHLGSKAFNELPETRQLILTCTVIAGCCEHKDHNCSLAGVKGMEAAWETLQLTPPVLLANKDNAATISLGNDADSGPSNGPLRLVTVEATSSSQSVAAFFAIRTTKKGHQDLHCHFFTKVKQDVTGEKSTVKFPDTSNNRFGTHNTGGAELVTYHSAYLDFFVIICDSKQTPGLNHSEQNAFNGLNDPAMMTECCVMTLYKNALSDPYVAAIRKPGVNHLDLRPLHEQVISHIEKLIETPDLVLDPTTPCEDATLDGAPFRDQFAVDSEIFVAFLQATLPAWRRFSAEFATDGIIHSLSPAEKLLMFIPSTKDANESLLGGCAWEAYHRNDAEAFADAMLDTEEDALYIMRLARVEDTSGAMRKFRDNLLAFKQRAAEESRAKQQAKEDQATARGWVKMT
ncbi:hypothetical protein K438DRAFT_1787305 [Mycena galopus ATCC 62051]|nr:hypothetical protein K438DRAFT_1787305 [Mycena galopus ATCC 62051]